MKGDRAQGRRHFCSPQPPQGQPPHGGAHARQLRQRGEHGAQGAKVKVGGQQGDERLAHCRGWQSKCSRRNHGAGDQSKQLEALQPINLSSTLWTGRRQRRLCAAKDPAGERSSAAGLHTRL